MTVRQLLAGSSLVVLAIGLLSGLARANAAPTRWGGDGHRMATRAAMGILPGEMPDFFRRAGEHLEYLGPEPDRWYSDAFTAMDEVWKHDHYIDLENTPPEALKASDRYEFIAILFSHGITEPEETVGFLPFRMLEMYQRLVTGFANWRLARGESSREWIQARVLNDAGILGHYVVDAAQPHHTTIHFNGWAEGVPNPGGYTEDRGFHSRFESGFVRAHLSYEDLPPLMPSTPKRLRDVRSSLWSLLQSSHSTVETLYRLEKEHGFEVDMEPHPDARDFAVQRLAAGAEMLAAIWWTAWVDSEWVAEEKRQKGG